MTEVEAGGCATSLGMQTPQGAGEARNRISSSAISVWGMAGAASPTHLKPLTF
jgi:hypothetical protein